MARAFGRWMRREDRDRLGDLLREVRGEAGLRQGDLAERLGVPQSVLSKIEAGERGLDLLEARAVCVALGLPLSVFVERLQDALAHRK